MLLFLTIIVTDYLDVLWSGCMKIHNQTVLLTGGVTIVNVELAKCLLAEQNTVILIDSNSSALQSVQQKLPILRTACFDLHNVLEHAQLVQYIQQSFPPVTTVMNCVSTEKLVSCEHHTPHNLHSIQQQLEQSFIHTISFTSLLLPHLQAQPESAVVNISTHTITLPKPYSTIYSIAQKALSSFSIALQQQFHHEKSNVHVFNFEATQINPKIEQQQSSGHISASQLVEKIMLALQQNQYDQYWGRLAHTLNCAQWMLSVIRKSIYPNYSRDEKRKI